MRVLAKVSILANLLLLTASDHHKLALATSPTRPFDQTHAKWNHILQTSVIAKGSHSQVNYRALKKQPEELNSYLDLLQRLTPEEFSTFSKNEKLAFLINAYNAFTVKLVLDHYPVKSIKEIGGLFSSPWKLKFFRLLGERRRLDDIEHEMIRKDFNEPRIHFALVCASKGCPALQNHAFIAPKLNEQLEAAAKTFLSDPERNRFDVGQEKLYISSIFKWYGGDFEKNFGNLKTFLAPYLTKSDNDRTLLLSPKTSLVFLDYDWSLNE